MTPEARQRSERREAVRLVLGGALVGIALVTALTAALTGDRKWLVGLALIPLAGMLQWDETCPRCGRSLRPAVLVDHQEVCYHHCGREAGL